MFLSDYRCDENGNVLSEYDNGKSISSSDSLTINNVAYEEMMLPRYYRATALIGNTSRDVIFTVMLAPMCIEVVE